MRTRAAIRRTELGAFLRSRRERRAPEQAGLPRGPRRRTPGLRREEVALLAGVGVTWYTWLEQGRPINASVQVLDAVARALGLDHAERAHLYRLAGVGLEVDGPAGAELPAEIQEILDGLSPLPAAVYNARYDVLAWNDAYRRLFPPMAVTGGAPRNVVWATFTAPDRCNPFVNRDEDMPRLVAELQTAFGRHVGEPAWERFVHELRLASPEFARLWVRREVVSQAGHVKRVRHRDAGELVLTGTRLQLPVPETRMMVYTPADGRTRERLALLASIERPVLCCEECALPGARGETNRSVPAVVLAVPPPRRGHDRGPAGAGVTRP